MKYRRLKGYKYQLVETEFYQLPGIFDGFNINTNFIGLNNGILTIESDYAWDGPSGPTIDTKTFMRGSLVHDALYQLVRAKELPESFRKEADRVLRDICREDGMGRLRAWYVYTCVRFGGSGGIKPRKEVMEEILEA